MRLLRSLYTRYRNIILYGLIGCTGASLDFLLYTVLTTIFDVYYIYANICSVLLGITNNFFLNRNLNFRVKDHTLLRYLTFFCVGIGGLIVSTLLLKFFAETLHIPQLSAKLLTIFLVVGIQFLCNKGITFRVGGKMDTSYVQSSDDESTAPTELLSLVMPVYNEKDIIGAVVGSWVAALRALSIDFRLYVYNDGSTDGTREILDDLSNRYPELTVRHKTNSGHGPTILSAYKALAKGEREGDHWIFQVDSDNELPPDAFKNVWDQRHGADFVVGRRSGRRQALPRRIVSALSRMVVRGLYGPGIWDVNSPYRLMRTRAFKPFIDALPADTFAPNVILTGCATVARIPSAEIPVPHSVRETGCESLNRWKLLKCAFRSLGQTMRFRFTLDTSGLHS